MIIYFHAPVFADAFLHFIRQKDIISVTARMNAECGYSGGRLLVSIYVAAIPGIVREKEERKLMKIRMITALALSAVMTMGMAVTATADDSADIGKVTLIMAQRDEFLSALEAGCKAKAEEVGMDLATQDANGDQNKVIQYVAAAAADGQKAVIVNVVDPTACQAVIDEAGDMKVVFVNRAGKFQGDFLAEYFNDKGQTEIKYILLNGIIGQTSTTLRTESVLKALEDGGIKAEEATAPLACLYDRTEAMNKISPLLAAGTEFDCIISNNDAMALGAIEACKNNGYDPSSFPIVGIDATADGRQAIKDGEMAMSVFQDPNGQGAGAVMAALNMVQGNPINDGTDFEIDSENAYTVWVPFEAVTPDNVADYDNR